MVNIFLHLWVKLDAYDTIGCHTVKFDSCNSVSPSDYATTLVITPLPVRLKTIIIITRPTSAV